MEAVPELVACANCTAVVAAKEQERRNTRCILCGRHLALRGFTVAVGGYVMRSGMCERCEKEHGALEGIAS